MKKTRILKLTKISIYLSSVLVLWYIALDQLRINGII